MSSTATLNIRLPEELKEHGVQVLSRSHISVSDAVRQLFCELERSQSVPDFITEPITASTVQDKRRLLRAMTGVSRRTPEALEPSIEPQGYDWREDWRAHLLEKHGGVI